jgi:hypothetical protein
VDLFGEIGVEFKRADSFFEVWHIFGGCCAKPLSLKQVEWRSMVENGATYAARQQYGRAGSFDKTANQV